MSEKIKISADSAFSFWAVEPKRKHAVGGISGKGHFRRRESDQSQLFCKKRIVNSLNYELLAKMSGGRDFLKHRRWLIQESWKLSYFDRKTSNWYTF